MGLVYRGEYASSEMVELELEFLDARLQVVEGAGSGGANSVDVENVTISKSVAAADAGSVFTNSGAAGATAFTLPAAVTGVELSFYVQTAQTMTVTAGMNDTIRVADNVTASAGSITSAVVGSFLTLLAVNDTEWVGRAVVGSWSF